MIGIMGGMCGPVLLPAVEDPAPPHEDVVEGTDPELPTLVLGASDEVGTDPDACPELEANPWALYTPWVFAAP